MICSATFSPLASGSGWIAEQSVEALKELILSIQERPPLQSQLDLRNSLPVCGAYNYVGLGGQINTVPLPYDQLRPLTKVGTPPIGP